MLAVLWHFWFSPVGSQTVLLSLYLAPKILLYHDFLFTLLCSSFSVSFASCSFFLQPSKIEMHHGSGHASFSIVIPSWTPNEFVHFVWPPDEFYVSSIWSLSNVICFHTISIWESNRHLQISMSNLNSLELNSWTCPSKLDLTSLPHFSW